MTQHLNIEHLPVGKHLILDLTGIRSDIRDEELPPMFEAACKDAGATVLLTETHKFGEEGGTTGVVILAESHCSWHHYPESQSIMIDIFTCGDTNPSLALPRILEYFKPRLQNCQCIVRGKF